MKYYDHDDIDPNDYEYIQSVALAESLRDRFTNEDLYELLEQEDFTIRGTSEKN